MVRSHVLLTRSPLYVLPHTVRLACVKHAASVHPEPGSNPPSMTHFFETRWIAIHFSMTLSSSSPPLFFASAIPILPVPPFTVKLQIGFLICVIQVNSFLALKVTCELAFHFFQGTVLEYRDSHGYRRMCAPERCEEGALVVYVPFQGVRYEKMSRGDVGGFHLLRVRDYLPESP